MTVRFLRSITLVPRLCSSSTSAFFPTATMRCPLIATASAIVKPSSTVTILPFTKIVSAGSAANADATAESHKAARTRIVFFTERFSERVRSEVSRPGRDDSAPDPSASIVTYFCLFVPADSDDGLGTRSRGRSGRSQGRQRPVEADGVLGDVGAAQVHDVRENPRGIDRDGAGI